MRLLTKTTLYFLTTLIVLLAAGGYFLFRQFSGELDRQTDQELIIEEVQWIRYLQSEADNGTTFILRTPELLVYPVDGPVAEFPTFSQTSGFSARQKKEVPYRQLSHIVSVRGIPYQLTIKKSQEQKAVFVANISRVLLLVFVLIFVVLLLFNSLINQTIWKPFKRTLEKIRGAELHKMEGIHFEKTSITEFNDLNTSLNLMAHKMYSDFVNMKEFTENAAHEMQTPLAVAQSKIELLLQDANLTDEQASSIAQASTALKRLSNLNQSLLLLAKIENNQFETNEQIDLGAVTKKYLQLFSEIIKDKGVEINTATEGAFITAIHPFLAESLISNLVGNAVKYNYAEGRIDILINGKMFKVSNTSHLSAIENNQLYKRFNKKYAGYETSNGLGLAIIKKICDSSQLTINYQCEAGVHSFTIKKATP